MSIADKATTISANNVVIAENEQKVFDSGYSQAELDWWNAFTKNNTRSYYRETFRQWGGEYFRPPFPIKLRNAGGCIYMFGSTAIKKFEKGYFDFSEFTPVFHLDTIKAYAYMFQSNAKLEEVEDIGLPASGYYYTWSGCGQLRTVEVMRSTAECEFMNPFRICYALENVTIEGEIGHNITFANNSKLTIDSLKSIINALVDYFGTEKEGVYTLTLNSGCLTTLETEGATSPTGGTWQKYIEEKGWNLA